MRARGRLDVHPGARGRSTRRRGRKQIEKEPVVVVKKEEPKTPEVKNERPPTRLEKLRREHAERVRARETVDAPPTKGGAS